jgi:SMI1 / KNR4 family (SUKH-1)
MRIKPTPETIWKRPAYLPYVHFPLTDEVVVAAEKRLGCALPHDFLDILLVQNGGPIRFSLPDSVGDLIAGIGPSFPSITDYHLTDHQDYVDFSLDGLVPFNGDGHWYRCLDYRGNENRPGVAYIDVECNSEHRIADSFSDFLDLMELSLENEMVLKNVDNIDDARTRLEALFGLPFERDISNIGVPQWTCKTGPEWDACFWITCNKVARGYSGSSPEEFQFEGESLLFPELNQDAVIFEAPEERLESYREKLGKAGLELVEIENAAMAT